jgi:hypothetical protein
MRLLKSAETLRNGKRFSKRKGVLFSTLLIISFLRNWDGIWVRTCHKEKIKTARSGIAYRQVRHDV